MAPGFREKMERFDPTLPLERARTIPSSWYTDPAILAAEIEFVFGNSWQAIGRLDQLAEAGSYLTLDLGNEPLLVVRDDAGGLRAFYNVCRHRAARLVRGPSGTVSCLRCPYHGWTYDLQGRLRGAPEFGSTADFRRDEQGLVELALDSWGPLLWVRIGTAPVRLHDYLDPLPQQHPEHALRGLRWTASRDYHPRCNWKVFIDNFLDGGYHVKSVHPELAGLLDYARYETRVSGNTSVQISPLRRDGTEEDSSLRRTRTGQYASYWWVFPNFFASIYEGVLITSLVMPVGVSGCSVHCDFYFAVTDDPNAGQHNAESVAVSEHIQQEDIAICEEVQRGLCSRSFQTGRYCAAREAAVYHFHRLLAQRLDGTAQGPCHPHSW